MAFLNLHSFAIIFILCLKINNLNAVLLFEGDSCVLNGSVGVCKLIKDCSDAVEKLKHQQIAPQLCSFQQKDPIVCCLSQKNANNSTTSTDKPYVVESKSYKMCREYAKSVFTTETAQQNFNVSQCAINSTLSIVDGQEARPREFPHVARIGFGSPDNKLWFCSGALISDKYVLTSGRCVYSMKYVQVGDLQNLSSLADIQDFDIIATHTPGSSGKHNIGLLELDRPVLFNSFVRPACLHTEQNLLPEALVSGWGPECFGDPLDGHILRIDVQILNHTECSHFYKVNEWFSGYLPEYHLCAQNSVEGGTLCGSASGDVLQIYNKDVYCMYSLIGVTIDVDWYMGFALYTRVSAHVPWIESIVWP